MVFGSLSLTAFAGDWLRACRGAAAPHLATPPPITHRARRPTKKPTSLVGVTVLKLCSTRTGRHHFTDTLTPVGAPGAFVAAFIVLVAILATVMLVPCRSPVSSTDFPAFAARFFKSWLTMV